jgi:hypothetical protein
MPTDIQQLWRENSYRTIISGKGLVQLRHFPADAGILFNKMDLNTHVPQIQGGLHAGDTASYDQNLA